MAHVRDERSRILNIGAYATITQRTLFSAARRRAAHGILMGGRLRLG